LFDHQAFWNLKYPRAGIVLCILNA